MKALSELWITEFPCGAFRVARTQMGAEQSGQMVVTERSCCNRGHSTFEVVRFSRVQVVASHDARRAKLRVIK